MTLPPKPLARKSDLRLPALDYPEAAAAIRRGHYRVNRLSREHRIKKLSGAPEDAVRESLDILKIPEGRWLDYLALELTDLPGWAGFIKWRAEGSNGSRRCIVKPLSHNSTSPTCQWWQ